MEPPHAGNRGRVLVTGATGFAAGHCICDLLAHGYDVRGIVRNLKTADMVRRMLAGEMQAIPPARLLLAVLDGVCSRLRARTTHSPQ